jgi:hypothetical protein
VRESHTKKKEAIKGKKKEHSYIKKHFSQRKKQNKKM